MNTFSSMGQFDLKIEEEGGNIQVRQEWDQEKNVMKSFGEQKVIPGIFPDDFRAFYDDWERHGAAANGSIDTITKVATDNGVDTLKIVIDTPWPLSNRVMFNTRYLEMDVDGGHIMLFCSAGNDAIVADAAIFTEKEKKKLVLATCFMIGFWVKPAKNDAGEVIGTHMLYFSSVDAGGSIPTFI